MSANAILSVRDLKAYYKMPNDEEVRAVDGVTLDIRPGEALGIAGESGCGKSTLSYVLSLFVQKPLYIKEGQVLIEGRDLSTFDQRTIQREVRGKMVSVVPQGAMNSLNPTRKIRHMVIDVLKEHNPDISAQEAVERGKERLEFLGLPPRVLDVYPHQLSGGMKQRVVTVISTLLNPKVLIVDEPTSALDVTSQKTVIKLLIDLLRKNIIQSIVFITHELPLLRHVADRIAIMYAGRIVELGTMEEIIFSPKHPYTQALIGSVLSPEPGTKGRRVTGIPGRPPDMKNPPAGCRFQDRCMQRIGRCREEPPRVNVGGREVLCWLMQEEPASKVAGE